MRAGLLDRTITVERYSETLDEAGVPVPVWTVVATLRAQLLRNETPETVTNSGANESIQVLRTFRTRFAVVNDHDRIIYEGAAYDIIDVEELGRRRGLQIRARKRGL
ncbi:hypothetical protein A1351_13995 [Methylosinus sp. R-45379]|uniref:phage head closure protein n=1 Tax=Methylosinus sp. R-45379 TaxID=980563 RepID=UPI0007C88C5B|nr:phage head closure protein [Methylosinus sp. R-45379]OAI26950.1 hypothetical protein A1351_13995 [Methylosinus sp. R-45379]